MEDLAIFVDNCYGELVEELEPCHVGADLVAGSLIKNLGGTLAPCGGKSLIIDIMGDAWKTKTITYILTTIIFTKSATIHRHFF